MKKFLIVFLILINSGFASEGGQVEEDAPEIHNDDEKK